MRCADEAAQSAVQEGEVRVEIQDPRCASRGEQGRGHFRRGREEVPGREEPLPEQRSLRRRSERWGADEEGS